MVIPILAGATIPVLSSVASPCAIPAIGYPPGQPPIQVVEAERRCARDQQILMVALGAIGLAAATVSTNAVVRRVGVGTAASAVLLLTLATVRA